MWRVPAASTLSWHSKRLRVVAMAGGARHIRAGGWRPASGWTRKPAYRRVVQMAARRSLEPYVAGSNPAPPANRSRMRIRSGELSVVEGSRDRVLAAADPWMVFRPVLRPYEAGACGRALADGLIAVRQGCSSMAEPLADAGSSPAASRLDGPWCRPRPQPGNGVERSKTRQLRQHHVAMVNASRICTDHDGGYARGCSSEDRAPAFNPEVAEFESRQPTNTRIAQLVERRSPKPQAGSSNLPPRANRPTGRAACPTGRVAPSEDAAECRPGVGCDPVGWFRLILDTQSLGSQWFP